MVREGFSEEVKLEDFSSGKEKMFHAEQMVCAKTQNMAHSGNDRCNKVDIRKSNFSNAPITIMSPL